MRMLVGAGLVALASLGAALSTGSVDAADTNEVAGRTVVVSTKPLEPFVVIDGDRADGDEIPAGDLRGYSVDVWNEIADRLDLTTEWVQRSTVGDILSDVAEARSDVAIAGISMTPEREADIDFTHPYVDSGLQIVTDGSDRIGVFGSIWNLLTSRAIVVSVLVLLVLLALVSHAIWWHERSHNPDFPTAYREGIVEALWWSTVNVVTGGEAVKEIRRPLSRLLALGWMVIGLFVLTFITAQAASAMTVKRLESSITGLGDLPGHEIGTVGDTVAAQYLDLANLGYRGYPDVDAALAALVDGEVDAVVYDAPVLAYRAGTDYRNRIELAGAVFAPDPYAIALQPGSELREPVNETILEMREDGTLQSIADRWFPAST